MTCGPSLITKASWRKGPAYLTSKFHVRVDVTDDVSKHEVDACPCRLGGRGNLFPRGDNVACVSRVCDEQEAFVTRLLKREHLFALHQRFPTACACQDLWCGRHVRSRRDVHRESELWLGLVQFVMESSSYGFSQWPPAWHDPGS